MLRETEISAKKYLDMENIVQKKHRPIIVMAHLWSGPGLKSLLASQSNVGSFPFSGPIRDKNIENRSYVSKTLFSDKNA